MNDRSLGDIAAAIAKEFGWQVAYQVCFPERKETKKEFCLRVRPYFSLRKLAILCQLRFGSGSKTVVSRLVNPKIREAHRKYDREWKRRNKRKK